MKLGSSPQVKGFYHSPTGSVSYVVVPPEGETCIVIDPVLDYDGASGAVTTSFVEDIAAYLGENALVPSMVLETHVHADHLSAAHWLKEKFQVPVAIGDGVALVQKSLGPWFFASDEISGTGAEFDRLFTPGEEFFVGSLDGCVLHTPGHTPACVSYLIGDALFCGDTLFMPDYGTARCDFPGGDAATLFSSIERIFALPDDTRIFTAHDYKPGGREAKWEASVKTQRAENKHVGSGISRNEFVAMRETRDAELSAPALILPALQVNLRAGRLPEKGRNGIRRLRIPLNQL